MVWILCIGMCPVCVLSYVECVCESWAMCIPMLWLWESACVCVCLLSHYWVAYVLLGMGFMWKVPSKFQLWGLVKRNVLKLITATHLWHGGDLLEIFDMWGLLRHPREGQLTRVGNPLYILLTSGAQAKGDHHHQEWINWCQEEACWQQEAFWCDEEANRIYGWWQAGCHTKIEWTMSPHHHPTLGHPSHTMGEEPCGYLCFSWKWWAHTL